MNLPEKDKLMLQRFFAGKPVKKAYLFGSYARNEAGIGSDIDLLVELDYSVPIGLSFVQMVLDLEAMLQTKVDLVTTDGLSKYVKPFVDKDKQLIYERAA
jgi:predicted nucleotidyltransferase